MKHGEHRLHKEVMLLEGQQFPKCIRCDGIVLFELVMGVADEKLSPFRVVLHQIPLVDESEESKAAAASSEEIAS